MPSLIRTSQPHSQDHELCQCQWCFGGALAVLWQEKWTCATLAHTLYGLHQASHTDTGHASMMFAAFAHDPHSASAQSCYSTIRTGQ